MTRVKKKSLRFPEIFAIVGVLLLMSILEFTPLRRLPEASRQAGSVLTALVPETQMAGKGCGAVQ